MKNTIYKAIQKQLVIDDNDSSISYNTADINACAEFPKIQFDDLYNIFKESPESIFSYDTINCISLILDNGAEISLHEYKITDNPVFLKISNDFLKEHGGEIILSADKNHNISVNRLKWATDTILIADNNKYIRNKEKAAKDFYGYYNTQSMLKTYTVTKGAINFPAAGYCFKYRPLPDYRGYLPAVGQLKYIFEYIKLIDYIFVYIMSEPITKQYYTSSTEDGEYSAWMVSSNSIFSDIKSCAGYVLPLFRKITVKNRNEK